MEYSKTGQGAQLTQGMRPFQGMKLLGQSNDTENM